MDACGCDEGFEIFDGSTAKRDVERYRRAGPDTTTRMLLDMIRDSRRPRSDRPRYRCRDRRHRPRAAAGGRGPRGARRRLAVVARCRPVRGAATRAPRPDRLRRRRLRRREPRPSTPPTSSRSTASSAAIPTWTRSSGCRPHALARCTASYCRATGRSSAGACASRTSGSGCAGSRIGRSCTRTRGWTRSSRRPGFDPCGEARTFVWRVVLYERGTAGA